MEVDPRATQLASELSESFPSVSEPIRMATSSESEGSQVYRCLDAEGGLDIIFSFSQVADVGIVSIRLARPQDLGRKDGTAVIAAITSVADEYDLGIKILGIKGEEEKSFWRSHHFVPNGHGWIPNPDVGPPSR